jgi:hypothetical protein
MFWKAPYMLAIRWMFDVFMAAISFAVLSEEHPKAAKHKAVTDNGASRREIIA